MSAALQKYAQRKGITLAQVGGEQAGQENLAQTSMQAQLGEQATASEELSRQEAIGEDEAGISLGAGMMLGKAGSMIKDAYATGKKIGSAADKIASSSSRIARRVGADSVADGIDSTRAIAKQGAQKVGDSFDALNDGAKGITQASRSGLQAAESGVKAAAKTTFTNISQAPDSIRSAMTDAVNTRASNMATLGTDVSPALNTDGTLNALSQGGDSADAVDKLIASGKTYTPMSQADRQVMASYNRTAMDSPEDLLDSSVGKNITFRPAGAPSLRTRGQMTEDLTDSDPAWLKAIKTGKSGMAGDQTLARATASASDPVSQLPRTVTGESMQDAALPSFKELGIPEPTPSASAGVEQAIDPAAEIKAPLSYTVRNPTFDPGSADLSAPGKPSAVSTDSEPTGQLSGGSSASSSTGNNGGLTRVQQQEESTSTQADKDLAGDMGDEMKDFAGDLSKTGVDIAGTGASELGEAGSSWLSKAGEFASTWGGPALETLGFAADLYGIGSGIYDLTKMPSEASIEKQKTAIEETATQEAIAKPTDYGSIAGATMDTMPDVSAGTFQHF